jgi:hypothetical protein
MSGMLLTDARDCSNTCTAAGGQDFIEDKT